MCDSVSDKLSRNSVAEEGVGLGTEGREVDEVGEGEGMSVKVSVDTNEAVKTMEREATEDTDIGDEGKSDVLNYKRVVQSKLQNLPPQEFLEKTVFPCLLQGMETLLEVARKESENRIGVSKRLLQAFDPLVWLSQYLFNNNPLHEGRDPRDHPYTEDLLEMKKFSDNLLSPKTYPPQVLEPPERIIQAAVTLQSFNRGLQVRRTSILDILKGLKDRSKIRPLVLVIFIQKIWRGAVVRKKMKENRLFIPTEEHAQSLDQKMEELEQEELRASMGNIVIDEDEIGSAGEDVKNDDNGDENANQGVGGKEEPDVEGENEVAEFSPQVTEAAEGAVEVAGDEPMDSNKGEDAVNA